MGQPKTVTPLGEPRHLPSSSNQNFLSSYSLLLLSLFNLRFLIFGVQLSFSDFTSYLSRYRLPSLPLNCDLNHIHVHSNPSLSTVIVPSTLFTIPHSQPRFTHFYGNNICFLSQHSPTIVQLFPLPLFPTLLSLFLLFLHLPITYFSIKEQTFCNFLSHWVDRSMDAQPGLSLGLNASPLSDNSFFFHVNPTPSVQWQLLEENDNKVRVKPKNEEEEEEEEEEEVEEVEDETINFMGRILCVKKRQIEGQPQQCFPSKRVAVDSGVEGRRGSVQGWGNQPLVVADPEIHEIMEKERQRQFKGIELIASENFVCRAVMEALGSHLTNKYSEGMPGAKYYTGNQHIDQIELLCCKRALAAFDLDPSKWGVNVQPYSCTSANFAVYTGLLHPGDRIMGLDSLSGGHLSHGYYAQSGKKVSAASIFFETLPYKVNPQTGYIDYEKLEEKALDYRPRILICGGSSYPREWDYGRFRQIADKCGAVLMCDMAHISGLVAAKEVASPFDYCDIVTSTTHKSLRGPRGGIIFYRRGTKPRKQGLVLNHGDDSNYDFEEKINFALYPSLQGGPHNNHIAALAIALKQVGTLEYKVYMQQAKKNASALASALLKRKCRLVTDGTDNNLLLWDLTALGLIDRNYEKVCEACYITLNKCAIYGSISPGGVRIGTPAMTSRGCLEDDFETIADFLFRAAQITSIVQREHGKSCKDFLKGLQNNKDIIELRNRIETFASQFAMPGFNI